MELTGFALRLSTELVSEEVVPRSSKEELHFGVSAMSLEQTAWQVSRMDGTRSVF
jgi:hypothetical protein